MLWEADAGCSADAVLQLLPLLLGAPRRLQRRGLVLPQRVDRQLALRRPSARLRLRLQRCLPRPPFGQRQRDSVVEIDTDARPLPSNA